MGTDIGACIEYHRRDAHGYGVRQTKQAVDTYGTTKLHRQIMMMVYGREAVEGRNVRHRCDNPPCFRFDHLELGTQADNLRDMFARGRNRNGKELMTHCKRGHEFTEENTRMNGTRRVCRTCHRETTRARNQQKRGQ